MKRECEISGSGRILRNLWRKIDYGKTLILSDWTFFSDHICNGRSLRSKVRLTAGHSGSLTCEQGIASKFLENILMFHVNSYLKDVQINCVTCLRNCRRQICRGLGN